MKRRDFLKNSLFAGAALSAGKLFARPPGPPAAPKHPVVISSSIGRPAVEKAMEMIKKGSRPIDAVVAGVTIVENDPEDITVGYGGLPNEAGVIQLDASAMDGATHNAGAVAAIENIKNPASVAKLVMERSDHVLLVGPGAKAFAKAHGFPEEDLMTEKTRKIWLRWKETLNDGDDWLPPEDDDQTGLLLEKYRYHYGTINCCAVNTEGDIAGVTTTSGLAFKIPGRVGDSPIIGAGLFVDNEVGAAGSTGRGEANLKNLCSFMVVEFMRMGKSPQEACLAVCKRIVDNTRLKTLLTAGGKPNFNVRFFAINKAGQYGCGEIYKTGHFYIGDARGVRKEQAAYLYKDR